MLVQSLRLPFGQPPPFAQGRLKGTPPPFGHLPLIRGGSRQGAGRDVTAGCRTRCRTSCRQDAASPDNSLRVAVGQSLRLPFGQPPPFAQGRLKGTPPPFGHLPLNRVRLTAGCRTGCHGRVPDGMSWQGPDKVSNKLSGKMPPLPITALGSQSGNPSVCPSGSHLPLHKGG